jgi:hypothetical protein
MANIEAPWCVACGYKFAYIPAVRIHAATWKGRLGAIACGLLASAIVQSFYA